MTEDGSPLYHLLNEINRAARGGLPLIAVAMAVALPDICVSLSSETGRTSSTRYKDWCKNNLINDKLWGFITPDDLWSMRCGVLHNGRYGDLKHNVGRVVFTLPGASVVNNRMNDAYVYSVVDFCMNFTQAVFNWCEKNKSEEPVKTNMDRLMQYRPEGLAPYIIGLPVLA